MFRDARLLDRLFTRKPALFPRRGEELAQTVVRFVLVACALRPISWRGRCSRFRLTHGFQPSHFDPSTYPQPPFRAPSSSIELTAAPHEQLTGLNLPKLVFGLST